MCVSCSFMEAVIQWLIYGKHELIDINFAATDNSGCISGGESRLWLSDLHKHSVKVSRTTITNAGIIRRLLRVWRCWYESGTYQDLVRLTGNNSPLQKSTNFSADSTSLSI